MYRNIDIAMDDAWIGVGQVSDTGIIYDCCAILGGTPERSEEAYRAIEADIRETKSTTGEVYLGAHKYQWWLRD